MMQNKSGFAQNEIRDWFDYRPSKQDDLLFPQVSSKSASYFLDYVNSVLIGQVDYILNTIEQHGLDFHENTLLKELAIAKDGDSKSRFPLSYRAFIHKTFHSIDEKAFFLFKYAYEGDRRYAYEMIENFHDFDEFLPISTI